MNQGPDFRHFVAFVTVAEQLSFGRAAGQLHITQPALSAQIKQLEDWHGERLFKRGHSGAELTESGRSFLVWARQILHMRRDAFSSTSRKHSPARWPFRLGYSLFTHHALIQEALKGYREIVPDREINSSSDCSAELVNMLNDGRLDAAIVTLPIFESELSEHEICTDRILVCLRADDPLAKGTQVPKSVLPDRLKIMFRRDSHPLLYDRFLKKFKAAGVPLRPTETYSAPSELQFLVETSGCFGLIREGRAGGKLLLNTPVVSWRSESGRVLVETAGERFAAKRLIVTAGAWASEQLGQVALPLTVKRKVLVWLEPRSECMKEAEAMPITTFAEKFFYTFPAMHGMFKVAVHWTEGQTVRDPRTIAPAGDKDIEEAVESIVKHLQPMFGDAAETRRRVVQAKTCLYTMTPDEHFVLDRIPEEPVWYAAGFSGHGFKFAPVVGKVLAEMALNEPTSVPVDFLCSKRAVLTGTTPSS